MNIERFIEELLGIDEKGEAEKPKNRKTGRPSTRYLIPIWAISEEKSSKTRTLALISMCIKEDMSQSIEELAERVAENKQRPYAECLAVLRELRKKGKLGYYDEERRLVRWVPGRKESYETVDKK